MAHSKRNTRASKTLGFSSGTRKRNALSGVYVSKVAKVAQRTDVLGVRSAKLAELQEDRVLNAIADERVDGPFVKVSLDDL